MATTKLQALWNHPAGPKTTQFTFGPLPLNGALASQILRILQSHQKNSRIHSKLLLHARGIIWSRYSTVIKPKNWNLFSVNVAMAGTGLYQLSRKIRHDYFSEVDAVSESADKEIVA